MRKLGLAIVVTMALTSCGQSAPSTAPETSASPGAPTVQQSAPQLEPGWTRLPEPPLTPRWGAASVWVDDSLLVFGGRDSSPCPPAADCLPPEEPPLRDGARWDSTTQTWTPIAPTPAASIGGPVVVDGTVYAIGRSPRGDGTGEVFVSYDPGTDEWEELPIPDGGIGWRGLAAGDGVVLLYPGSHEVGERLADLRFDPSTQTWTPLPQDPLGPSFDRNLAVVDGLVVLTGIDITPQPGGADGPARYRAATWSESTGWRELPAGDVIGFDPIWLPVDGRLVNPTTGGADGGATNPYGRVLPFGGILDPRTGEWSDLPAVPPDEGGAQIAPFNMGDGQLLVSSMGWALQPRTGTWHLLDWPPDGDVDLAAVTVGGGHLYMVGGVAWRSDLEGEILGGAWVWTPPS